MHDERISSPRAKNYPLLLMSNHGRWRVHSQCDDITWTREAPTCKITGPDGYKYEPIWIHTSEAEKRGIKHGEIIKIFNERGIVLGGAYVTERLRAGVAYMRPRSANRSRSSWAKWIAAAPSTPSPQRHYFQELRRPGHQRLSGGGGKSAPEMSGTNGAEANPEAFARPYEKGAGPAFRCVGRQGGGGEMKAFVLDLSICNGCYCCQIACKDEHVANDWMPYAKPQPDYRPVLDQDATKKCAVRCPR